MRPFLGLVIKLLFIDLIGELTDEIFERNLGNYEQLRYSEW